MTFIFSLFYCAVTYILFYRQCVGYLGMYNSDMAPYIATINGEATEYNFTYPLMFKLSEWLSKLCGTPKALAIVVTVLNLLTFLTLVYYLFGFFKKTFSERKKIFWILAANLSALSLMFVSMLYIPGYPTILGHSFSRRCVGVFSPNPYWNATFLATRPFTVVNFFSAVKLLESYEKEAELRNYLIFGISLFLTTITKPSYTLVAVVTFIFIFVFRLIKAKGKNFKETVLFGLTFLPAGLDCIYQYRGIFTGTNVYGEETGIGLAFGKAWHTATDSIFFSVILAGAFALWILLMNIKRLKDCTWFRYAWELYAVGLLMFAFLYEKGFRLFHCNFAWGYVHAMLFVFMAGFMMLVENTKEFKNNKFRVVTGWLAYLAHLVCGINFFLYLMAGGDFFWY